MKLLNLQERKAMTGGFVFVSVSQFPAVNPGIPRPLLDTLGMSTDILGYSSMATWFKDLEEVKKPLSSPALQGLTPTVYRAF